MAYSRLQTPEKSLQSIVGCLSACQGSRFPMLWTIPCSNHGTGISKTLHNALQGIFSSQTIYIHHLTQQNAAQVNSGGLNGISGMALPWYLTGLDTDRLRRSYLDLHSDPKQNTEHNFTEKMFSVSFLRMHFQYGKFPIPARASGRARACVRVEELKRPLKIFKK